MKLVVKFFTLSLYLHFHSSVDSLGLREEFTWSRIDYAWPSSRVQRQAQTRSGYIQSGSSQLTHGSQGVDPDIIFPGSNPGPISNNQRPLSGGNRYGNHHGTGTRPNVDGSNWNGGVTPFYDHVVNIPMGAHRWRNKLFVMVPRRRLGVPSTFNYVPIDSSQRHNVPLIPYPDWETNVLPSEDHSNRRGGNQIKLTSVYRVDIDPCDRLWVVDTGNIETLGNASRIQPSQIVIFDLNTDTVIRRFEFPTSQITSATNLALITVDVTPETCSDAYAYLPDVGGFGLVVYSFRQNRSWRVTHNFFHLEPLAGEFNISGHAFQWNDGIFSIALSEMKVDGYRDAFFHSMAGTHLYVVSTQILQNETLATRSYHGRDFKIVGNRGDGSQTSASDLHQPSKVLFLGLVNQNALGCWNTERPLEDISIVKRNDTTMIYPCDVKIVGDDVLVLTNAMPEFLYGRLNYDRTNFRIWVENVRIAIAGTKCEPNGGRKGGTGGRY